MDWFWLISLFILGAVFGSFFLASITRGMHNESIIKPSSYCDNCKKKLSWYELIPIFSYIFLGGICHKCHKKISSLCIIVEIITSLLFMLSYYIYGFNYQTIILIISFSLLITTSISDFKELIILNTPTIVASILLVIVYLIFIDIKDTLMYLLGGLSLFIFMFLVKKLGDLLFKRESLGGGDIKLSIFIGLLLGIKFGLLSFVISSFIALPFAFIFSNSKKEKEVPFGPFLLIGAIITFIFSNDINNILTALLQI